MLERYGFPEAMELSISASGKIQDGNAFKSQ